MGIYHFLMEKNLAPEFRKCEVAVNGDKCCVDRSLNSATVSLYPLYPHSPTRILMLLHMKFSQLRLVDVVDQMLLLHPSLV